MSYEGYVEGLCKNGHRAVWDAYEDVPEKCKAVLDGKPCEAAIVFENDIDDTNCDMAGAITNWERFIVSPLELGTCDHCKHTHVQNDIRYRVPAPEEIERF